MSKVVVLSTSLRAGSNSHALAEQFAEGAKAAGHEVELISLRGKEIKFCIGCFSCQTKGKCVFKDDVPAIMESVLNADVVCWATPIYYYEMAGQMKTLIDRLNPMYPKDYKFRDIYLLTTATEDEAFVPERAVAGLTGWVDCFERARLAGTVFAGGVNEMGETALSVYPNPAQETLHVKGLNSDTTVEIYNSLGVLVKTLSPTATNEISINDLTPGLYTIRNGKQIVRFVKTL